MANIYIIYGYYALAAFFAGLGISHRLDETEDGPTYVFPFFATWLGFMPLLAIVTLLLAHFLVPVLTFPTLNITQHITNNTISLKAHWSYPEGGGFAGAGWWLAFYAALAALVPVTSYWVGWRAADFVLTRVPHIIYNVERETITRIVHSRSAAETGVYTPENTPLSLAQIIGEVGGNE